MDNEDFLDEYIERLMNPITIDALVRASDRVTITSILKVSKRRMIAEMMCPAYDNGRCNGTRHREKCSCRGDKNFCDYYKKGKK